MINDKLIHRASAILFSRYTYWEKEANKCFVRGQTAEASRCEARSAAYRSAYDILWYAINNNEECLKEFDYYAD